ncbi:TPA: GNAT family N-acetyltransferase [Bacillus cereus]|uniref:GNAT family N-acetyltransferase n=1 Tax=Bacillus TaxID=1386 RepID=UPI000863F984|nr:MULTISPECIES: GNAT family N-acetyltransferase [Bacillus]MCP1180502.1 GNAT family N-acetyltransferase [Bacillus sp. 1663tsa1]MCP1285467.1 GNAT family N-acetyltransferase [Bacillus sp. S0635]MCQ6349490.1 GNAT family N-acetyltransferase [Bacillus cereus]MCU5751683.1 GNAT family N-acetyltransferase [Bacillus cereus]SCM91101.1 Acetyltransferase, GNAT [Bacillus cereus]
MNISSTLKIEEIASFIASMNKDATHHVGYCGDEKEELLHTILHDFSDIGWERSFVITYEDNKIIGVLGFDVDEVKKCTEIWGPFIKAENWEEVAVHMWKKLIEKVPFHIEKFYGFYHVENNNCARLMKDLRAKEQDRHSILILNNSVGQRVICNIEEISPPVFEQFSSLHNHVFPHTYYEGNEIIERLGDTNKLFVSMKNDKLEGYVYVEVNPEFHEAHIEFIATSKESRGKGVGERLLRAAIQHIFSFQGMEMIELCLNTNNEGAMKLYKKVGFEEKACLQHYIIE